MEETQEIILRGYKALIIRDESIILYKAGKLFLYENGTIHFLVRLKKTGLYENIRIANRLLRKEPKYAKEILKNLIMLIWNKQIYLVDLSNNNVQIVGRARDKFSDPLNVCIPHISNKYIAIWGDYGSNRNHEDVYIYGLDYEYNVKKIYTFPPRTIRHIHNIVPKLKEGYYIFTGDTEEEAGIYEATETFDKVIPLAIGKQKYRAVVGFETEAGLIYATDAVNEKNYIYLLQQNDVREIRLISGSCIYGTKHKNRYFFSTTVEPDERCKGWKAWFSYKKGDGILSDSIEVVSVDEQLNTEVFVSYEKDILPMKLFQYGTVQFPSGDGSLITLYPIAVKRYDGDTIVYKDK